MISGRPVLVWTVGVQPLGCSLVKSVVVEDRGSTSFNHCINRQTSMPADSREFSVPAWVRDWISVPTVAVREGGLLQTHVITAHVATGSLILVMSLAIALYAQRLLADEPRLAVSVRREMGAAV